MKVLTLLGSARKNGNTSTVLGWVEKELEAMGHEVERISLPTKDIKPCLGCAKCKESDTEINCVQKDDANEILEKMIEADIHIFASPTYFWGYAAPVKALMDRSWAFVTKYKTPEHTSLIEGKKQAVVLTGGSTFENNAEGLTFAFNKLQIFYKTENGGELFVGKCSYDGTLPEDAEERAVALARSLGS